MQHAYANQPLPQVMHSIVNRPPPPKPMPPLSKHSGPLPAGPMLPQYSGPSSYSNLPNSVPTNQIISQQQYNQMQSHDTSIKNNNHNFDHDRPNSVTHTNSSHHLIGNTSSPPPQLPTLPKPYMQMQQQSSAQNNGVNNVQLSTQNLPPHYESQQLSPQANVHYTAKTAIVDTHERSIERLPVNENNKNQVQQATAYHQSYENIENAQFTSNGQDPRSNQQQIVHCSPSPNPSAAHNSPSVNVTNQPVEDNQVNKERSYSNQQEIVMMNQNNHLGNHQRNQTAAQKEHQQR